MSTQRDSAVMVELVEHYEVQLAQARIAHEETERLLKLAWASFEGIQLFREGLSTYELALTKEIKAHLDVLAARAE